MVTQINCRYLRLAQDLQIASFLLADGLVHSRRQPDPTSVVNGFQREYRQNLLQDEDGVVHMHELLRLQTPADSLHGWLATILTLASG